MERKFLIAFLCFSLSLNVFSQSMYIGKFENVKSVTLDSINKKIYIFFDDYYKKVDITDFKTDSVNIYIEKPFQFIDYTPVIVDSKNYFVHNKGGLVYSLNNDTIKRIDRSFDHKMQSNAQIFPYKSHIYKYGGYGFWEARNMFTYFDENLAEWFAVNPIYSNSQPIGTFNSLFKIIQNEIYIFSGNYIDPYDRIGNKYYNKVWKFNLDTKKWYYLEENNSYFHTNPKVSPIVDYKNTLLIIRPTQIEVIDIVNNNLIKFQKSLISMNLAYSINSFFTNSKFYLINGNSDQLFLTIVNEKDFFGKKISEEPFYNNYTLIINTIVILFSLVLLSVLIIMIKRTIKKRNKILLFENGLRYKNKFAEFDLKSLQIIETLISSEELSSNKILGIIEEKQYSIAHNERIKIQKLEEINFKIKTLLGVNIDVIQSKKSDKDRRIRVYSIKSELFFIKP